jgi:hypothetical protein
MSKKDEFHKMNSGTGTALPSLTDPIREGFAPHHD